MATIVPLTSISVYVSCSSCEKIARYQVLDRLNNSVGVFCKHCAEYTAKQLDTIEKEQEASLQQRWRRYR